MARGGATAVNFQDLRRRVLFVVGALVVFRIGSHVPLVGIDATQLRSLFQEGAGSLLNFLNAFSGGSISRLSVFTLGIIPYITASIIMNLAAATVPSLEQLKKEGTLGRRKLTNYTRLGTVALTAVQGTFVAIALERFDMAHDPGLMFRFTTVVGLVAGTIFLMWLGEQITERGIGNGISIIIFASIVAGLPQAIAEIGLQVGNGAINPLTAMMILAGSLALIAGVVFVERGQRRVPLNHAKQQRQLGGRMGAGQRSHLPFKINMAGVMPAIFGYAVLFFPAQIVAFSEGGGAEWLRDLTAAMDRGQPLYLLVLAAFLIFFTFFYVDLTSNPKETADTLRRSGAVVPGIRPGPRTASYIEDIVKRLTLIGAIYITMVCLIPELLVVQFAGSLTNFVLLFGGTSLLIIVVVAMDFMEQVQHYMMTQQYGNLLKKVPGAGAGLGLPR